jgi:hypothetical protein
MVPLAVVEPLTVDQKGLFTCPACRKSLNQPAM